MAIAANSFDTAVRAWIVGHQTPTGHRIAALVSEIGAVAFMRWIGVIAAIFLLWQPRRRAAFGVVIAPLLAFAAHDATTHFFPRVRPPGGAGYNEANSFPSAHATASTAVCCTLAYILWRERLLTAPVAVVLAVVPPLCVGLSRLYLDVHWATDVLGGWCMGLAVLCVAGGVYRFWPATKSR